CMQPLEFPLTF
nr:immunoglobulin light chain junction region [Macaca mulatta]MOV78847.1 immunoglobulin light chain junction region [Macaca mulatta]MOV79631.1 immunoglobulin light chain junction region [Macaca mulatta]MOV83010.1 immunoglobulin light chain junction region [Macaca mulatta]MOV83912.1 immunoglobulin light chain junction region [Macaca mulatta]